MFRNWIRSRLGLNAATPSPNQFGAVPGGLPTGFENRPKSGIEQWVPRPQNLGVPDYAPKPNIEQWVPHQQAGMTDMVQNSGTVPVNQGAGDRRMGFALNPYMW